MANERAERQFAPTRDHAGVVPKPVIFDFSFSFVPHAVPQFPNFLILIKALIFFRSRVIPGLFPGSGLFCLFF